MYPLYASRMYDIIDIARRTWFVRCLYRISSGGIWPPEKKEDCFSHADILIPNPLRPPKPTPKRQSIYQGDTATTLSPRLPHCPPPSEKLPFPPKRLPRPGILSPSLLHPQALLLTRKRRPPPPIPVIHPRRRGREARRHHPGRHHARRWRRELHPSLAHQLRDLRNVRRITRVQPREPRDRRRRDTA